MFDVAEFFESFVDDVKRGPVAPHIAFGDTLRYLAGLPELVDDVRRMLLHGNLHTTHPAYFGLFNPHVTLASVVADAMAAANATACARSRSSSRA